MDRRDYLPSAVAFGFEALEDLDDSALKRLQIECLEWLILAREFRCEVSTPNAVVVWNALIKLEVAMVVAAEARIEDVRRARRELAR